jgi:DNA repair exonuclease SbcCD ATPase subunit
MPRDIRELVSVHKTLQQNITIVNETLVYIKQYSKSFYNNALTKLAESVSSILHMFDSNLCIKGKLNESNNIEWYIVSKSVMIPINKASGFQRFAIGLAFRLVFNYLSDIKVSQFYIDEGFSSCDEKHLSCVPDFLNNLLTNFDFSSILVVTHLEKLQDAFPHISIG